MRNKKKYLSILLVIATVITGVAKQSVTTIASGHRPIALNEIHGTEVYVGSPGSGFYNYYPSIYKIAIDNETTDIAFCIEAQIIGLEGEYIQEETLDQDFKKELSLIKYYAYDLSPQSDYDYATAQFMIWERMGVGVNVVGSFSQTYNYNKAIVQEKINNHYIEPSFANSYTTVNAGEVITLTDLNGVLQFYEIYDSGGLNASIVDNTLTIVTDADSEDYSKIQLSRIKESSIGSTLTYRSNHPDGQDVSAFNVEDRYISSLEVGVNKYGNLKIEKFNDNGQAIPGTQFKVSKNSTMENALIYSTDEDGIIFIDGLEQGTYYIQEIDVKEPYLNDGLIEEVNVTTNNTSIYKKLNQRAFGSVELLKRDSETELHAQGDAMLVGATYGLYADEDIIDALDGGLKHKNGSLIQKQKIDETLRLSWKDLEFGKYYIKEIEAPTGYQLDKNEHKFSLDYKDNKTAVVNKTVISKENVIKGDFDLRKVIGQNESGVQNFEKGAKFTVRLKSDIEKHGTEAKVIDRLVTDDQGYAKSSLLPYGEYVVSQENAGEDNLELAKPFNVKISKHEVTLHYVVSNKQYNSLLGIEKFLTNTNEIITFSRSTFKIWDYQENGYYYELVGRDKIDSWVTDNDGIATTANPMFPGKYAICEIEAAKGTLLENECLDFEIKQSNAHEIDDNGRVIQYVRFGNIAPTATIKLNKTFEYLDNKTKESGFALRNGSQAVISPSSGEVIHVANEIINNPYSKDGLWYTKDGHLEIKDLPLGIGKVEYVLKEEKTSEEYEISDEELHYFFDASTSDVKEVAQEKELHNKLKRTDIELTKVDAYTKNAIVGLHGFTFNLYSDIECTELVDTKTISPLTGKLVFEDIVYGKSLYLVEESSNETYYKTDNVIPIKFDMNLKGIGNRHDIAIENTKKPVFETVATTIGGGNEIDPTIDNVLFDTVSFFNIDTTKDYILVTSLIEYESGEIFNKVISEITKFDQRDGSLQTQMLVDADALENERYYFSQLLYSVDEDSYKLILEHDDRDDLNQTIYAKKTPLTLNINKIDSVTNELITNNEFEFEVEAFREDELIETVSLMSDSGTISFEFFGKGTYDTLKITEVNAPLGYQLSTEEWIVHSTQFEDNVYTLDIKNEKIKEEITTGVKNDNLILLLCTSGFILLIAGIKLKRKVDNQ